jgi:hypothetical protein
MRAAICAVRPEVALPMMPKVRRTLISHRRAIHRSDQEFSELGTAELPEQRESRPFRGRRHRAG